MAVNLPGLIAIIIFYIIILVIGLVSARKRRQERGEELATLSRNAVTTVNGTKSTLYAAKEKSFLESDHKDIMLGGRKFGLFIGTFTMTATWVGGGYINGTAESVYNSGLVWAQAPWGYAFSLLIGGLLFAKIMRTKGYVTMLDPLQHKYGNWMGGLLYIPALLGETFWSAAILSALGATLSVVLDLNIDVAVIVSACIAVCYTFFGGLYSVAYTDVVQLICIFIGLWMTIPFAMTHKHVKKVSQTDEQWIGTLKQSGVGQWIDYALLLTFGGIPWQVYFQRVLSSKSAKYAQLLSFTASFGCIVMAVPAFLVGAVAKSTAWGEVGVSQALLNDSSISDTRLVLPMVLQYLTPTWVSFFGLGAISAAVMSSADSSVLSASSMFSYNIYKMVLRPKASERELIWVIRLGIFGVGAIATIMALTIKSVYGLWTLCSDLVYVILFPQLLCAVYVPFVNSYGSLSAFLLGFILRLCGGEPLIGLRAVIKYPYYNEQNNEQHFPFRTLSMLFSLATLLGVSYLFKFLFEREYLPAKYDILRAVVLKSQTSIQKLDDEKINEDDHLPDKLTTEL